MLLALVLAWFCCCTGIARAGYAAIVVDGTSGKVLDEVHADEHNHPASLTKMMTLYLTFQRLHSGQLRLDQQLPVSAWAASKAPTKLGLVPGRTISVRDCILGMVTKSANDAATVVAEAIGGSEQHFVEMMNAQALMLGMTDTHFDNASGLPGPSDASTARDLVKLARALYRDFPQDAAYFATREFTFQGKLVVGHNHLLDRYPGMDGLKTGFTDAAGFNLASTAVRDGHRLFAVVMGGRTAQARDDLMARLLDDGFDGRQTPDSLVAQAGMVSRISRTRRALAALSPIKSAEADTVPASLRTTHRRRHVVVARAACTPRKGTSCTRHGKRAAHRAKGGSATLAARAANRKAAATERPADSH